MPSNEFVLAGSRMKRADLNTLAHELAEEAARSDVECFCRLGRIDSYLWWDISAFHASHRKIVERAVRYLDARKRLIHRQRTPQLVRFEDGP